MRKSRTSFWGNLEQSLALRDFNAAVELCDGDRRAMPQLALYAITNRDLGFAKLRGAWPSDFSRT